MIDDVTPFDWQGLFVGWCLSSCVDFIPRTTNFIIHQTHNKKSDWSRAFNQFTIACELDMINAISAADISFIMSSSTSAWLLSPLECSHRLGNKMAERFASVFEDELCEKCIIKQLLLNSVFAWYLLLIIIIIIKTSCLCYLPQPSALADNTDLGFDHSRYHAQPHPIIV